MCEFAALALAFCAFSVSENLADERALPPPASVTIDFARDIQPIFSQTCLRCHGVERPKGGLRLDTREHALRGGERGADIVPGRSAESRLIQVVARVVPDLEMPPPGKGTPLTPEQIALLRAWIDQGAAWSAATNATAFRFTAAPTIGGVMVGGNRRAFRELEGMREGVSGGVEELSLDGKLRGDARLRLEGRASSSRDDYRAKLALEQPDVGFVRAGFQNQRRYYDDTGGYYAARSPSQFSLGRDLHADFSKAWIEVGLTLPHLPRITLGYEQQRVQGTKSTVNWGPVGTVDAASIYPAFEELRDRVHVLRLDLSHEVAGFTLEDNFRAEFQDLRRTRETAAVFTPPAAPDVVTRFAERHREQRVANVFRAERRIREWLLLSGGHFFSHADADATLRQDTLNGAGAPIFGELWIGGPVVLKRDTHSVGGSALLGPWGDLSFSSAVQAEWTRQEAMAPVDFRSGDPSVPFFFFDPASLATSFDRTSIEEHFGARYTGVPRTVLFAEARFRQEDQRKLEQQTGGPEPFLNDQDSTRDVREYRLGASVAACDGVTLSGHLKRRETENRFDRLAGAPPSGHAYPGFMRARDIDADEGELRVNWRPRSWFRAGLSYRVQANDYRTTTVAAPDVFGTPGGGSPGGGIFAGNYDAQFYGLNLFVAPIPRLTLSSALTFGESRLTTAQNGAAFVAPARGDNFSVSTAATFALDAATDLAASGSWSGANYRQNNASAGLPAGTDYERFAADAGLHRRWSPRLASSLRYQFVQYREPTAGGARDYSAHGVFATFSVTLP